ncbi:glucose-6-phosphate isomerase family protein [Lachnospiraceae bacterium 54-11]
MKIIEPRAGFMEGVIKGKEVSFYKKTLGEMKDAYRDTSGMEPYTLLYTTYSYEAGDSKKAGDLYFGLTVLEPVTVNGECCMTRGHFHLERNCAEFYFGISGSGLLLLMDDEGKTWAEKVEKGSIHHIAGNLAHRLINTGDEQLKVGACWPTVAGHDYEAIEKRNFGYRILKKDGKIAWEDDRR